MKLASRALLCLVALAIVFGLGVQLVHSAEPPALRIVTSFQIRSLDPVEQGFWMPEFGVAELLMQFRQDGRFYPWLLESLTLIDDLNWRATLRPGITFQNGKPLNAQRLVAVLDRQMKLSSSAQGTVPEGTTFKVEGDLTVIITTQKPYASMPSALSNEAVFPVYDVEAVEAVGTAFEKLAGAGIYTGPYQIVSLTDTELTLTRYEQY